MGVNVIFFSLFSSFFLAKTRLKVK